MSVNTTKERTLIAAMSAFPEALGQMPRRPVGAPSRKLPRRRNATKVRPILSDIQVRQLGTPQVTDDQHVKCGETPQLVCSLL